MLLPILLATQIALANTPERVADARFSIAVYGNPTLDDAVLDELEASLSTIRLKSRLPRTAKVATRTMGLAATEDFQRPVVEDLGPLADGLGTDGAAVLTASQEVVVASFAVPKSNALSVMRQVYGAFSTLALASGGVVEEVYTQRLFDAANFKAHADELGQDPFDTSLVYVIVPVEDEDRLELSTQGLSAIGLQELRMEQVAPEESADMAAILCGLAQISWEQGGLVETTHISPESVTLASAQTWLTGIAGDATSSYAIPRWGEVQHPVAQVLFTGTVDDSTTRQMAAPVGAALEGEPQAAETPVPTPVPSGLIPQDPGAPPAPPTVTLTPLAIPAPPTPPEPPEVAKVESPPEPSPLPAAPVARNPSSGFTSIQPASLEEALTQASQAMATSIKPRFQSGLPQGDALYVKAPYLADDHAIEYLWIEVQGWNGSTLYGAMRSEPSMVTSVHANDQVTVSQEIVYDYLLRHADGSTEGNRTEAFIR